MKFFSFIFSFFDKNEQHDPSMRAGKEKLSKIGMNRIGLYSMLIRK